MFLFQVPIQSTVRVCADLGDTEQVPTAPSAHPTLSVKKLTNIWLISGEVMKSPPDFEECGNPD
jgi:hypothetical protein